MYNKTMENFIKSREWWIIISFLFNWAVGFTILTVLGLSFISIILCIGIQLLVGFCMQRLGEVIRTI